MMLGAAGLGQSRQGEASDALAVHPEVIQLSRNGWMPNNEHLPVLLYRSAIRVEGGDAADRFEAQFRRNGWPPSGAMACTTFTTITRRLTKCSGSRLATRSWC